MHITSKENPKYKYLKSLLKKRERDTSSLCLIEGAREILRFPKLKEVYYSNRTAEIVELIKRGVSVIEVESSLLNKLTVREGEALAIGEKVPFFFKDLQRQEFLLVLEGIENPGNLGAILRSADGAGVNGIILCDSQTDEYHPTVVRNSLGIVGSMPIVHSSAKDALAFLEEEKLDIVVTMPDAKESYYKRAYKKPVAIVMGSESKGVSSLWGKRANICVSIPMRGRADSLNLSVATAILLYEVRRQKDG